MTGLRIMSPGTARLAVRKLTLSDFRCYPTLRIETDARPVVLTGSNGAGKTNILEALSFLAPGRGLRRATLAQVARHGPAEKDPSGLWAVAASLEGPSGRMDIGTGLTAGTERRALKLDGKPARPVDLAGLVAALWLTPAMDRLFLEGAGGRRRFMDRLVLGMEGGHAREWAAYEHAMRERTRVLKDETGDPGWLSALESAMARHGIAVASARKRVIRELDRACAARQGAFPAARLAVSGEVESWLDSMDEAMATERLSSALAMTRGRDHLAGAATLGPHRSDLAVRHAVKDQDAGDCSTGEQKAVLISIVLSQAREQAARTGTAPLVLLDEVVAHLDGERRQALFVELAELDAQSWMTGTDRGLFDGFGDRAQYFHVAEATLTPYNPSGKDET